MELQDLAEANPQVGAEIEPLVQMSENIRLSNSKLINQINSWVYTHHFLNGIFEKEVSAINMASFSDAIIETNQYYLTKKGIKLEKDWESDISLTTDKDILRLILDNLFTQIIIFSDNRNLIRFTLSQTPDTVTISIGDQHDSDRREVIERFLDEAGEITGDEIPEEGILKATGYGMIFCGQAIKILDGQASVEPNDLGGLTFSMQFKK